MSCGQGRARDVAAQLLQALALVGGAAHRGVQAEILHVGTQRLRSSAHRPGQKHHLQGLTSLQTAVVVRAENFYLKAGASHGNTMPRNARDFP